MLVRHWQCPWRARQLLQLWRPLRVKCLHSERAAREDKRWPGWEVVVGIEVHAQIKSRRKLFSGPYAVYLSSPPRVDACSSSRRADVQAWRNTQLVRHLL